MKICKLTAALTLGVGCLCGQNNSRPLSEPPQKLIDKDGKPEIDLIDPFQSSTLEKSGETAGGNMSSTAVNILPKAIKILAIVVPEDKPSKKMALLKLSKDGSPFVVKEGDLIKVRNENALKNAAKISKIVQKVKGRKDKSAEIEALKSFEYYLHIKKINSQVIEVFPKKSPDELIILRW